MGMQGVMRPSEVALRRLLDTLAASAQPVVRGNDIHYRWGQHITDDAGDNIRQYGLHGSSQAVFAFAAGVVKLGGDNQYHRFLTGGVANLAIALDNPYRELDFQKTVKVSELVGALAAGGAPDSEVVRGVQKLLEGRDPSTGGWRHNLLTYDGSAPHLWPTVYAVDGLVHAYRKIKTLRGEIASAIGFCVNSLRQASLEESTRTCLYKLVEAIERYELLTDMESEFTDVLQKVLKRDGFPHYRLTETKRFEYRIRTLLGDEQHAFCVIPLGIAQLRVEIWTVKKNLNVGVDSDRLTDRLGELISLIYSPHGYPLRDVRSFSYTARLLAELGDAIDQRVRQEGQPSPPCSNEVAQEPRRLLHRSDLDMTPGGKEDIMPEPVGDLQQGAGTAPGGTGPRSRHVVLLLHGIRTLGIWQDEFQQTVLRLGLDRSPESPIQPVPLDIGVVSTMQFAVPWVWRRRALKRFLEQYELIQEMYQGADISVIAHSFGTYIVYRAMRRPHVHFKYILMAGSLLPRAPRWRVFGFGSAKPRVEQIINDIGVKDHWVLMARLFVPGMGPSGLLGFSGLAEPAVVNRRFPGDHNAFFTEEQYEKRWMSILRHGITDSDRGPAKASDVPKVLQFMARFARSIQICVLGGLIALSVLLIGRAL